MAKAKAVTDGTEVTLDADTFCFACGTRIRGKETAVIQLNDANVPRHYHPRCWEQKGA